MLVQTLLVVSATSAQQSLVEVQQIQFRATTYTVGSNPRFVTGADVNGDGILDLLVANDSSSDISILLGNGDGTYKAAVNYAAGGRPFSIAVDDFNSDGKPDFAVAGGVSGGGITIFTNNGNGTFLQTQVYSAPSFPTSVTSADFDGDGKLDLVWTGYNDDTVNIMLGNGDGTFHAPVSYAAGTAPEYVVTGDFNNDGKLDLANTNEFQSRSQNYPGTMSVLLGNGDGTFQAFANFNAGNLPYGLAVGDFNEAGNLDAVVANSSDNYVSVFLGEGDGRFAAATGYTANLGCISTTVGDFNLDGVLDLAVANVNRDDVSILFGNGDGSFQPPVNFVTGTAPYSVAADDFNDDGYLDLVTANYVGTTITVLLNVPVASDNTPPTITITATPDTLWPPNGKLVPVTIAGMITDDDSDVDEITAVYKVIDEYSSVQPSGEVTIASDGTYSFTIYLQASRHGNDRDGRQYSIIVYAEDLVGNKGSATTDVIVPHDQGH